MAQLSPADEDLLRRLGSEWRLTPATLAYHLSRGAWIPAKWLLYCSTLIAKAISQGNGRIIISAPPRHGKSRLIDIWTPVWILENFPGYQVVLASYGADLSEGFGREVRDIIQDNQDSLRIRIRKDSSRVDDFLTEGGGGMMSRGLKGSITGRGANVLLIDDYVKEIKEALSQVYRDYIWNWFTTTAYTRLEPGGTCIIIATRWHSDDLIGRILAAYPGQWTNIVLPAIAEQDDIIGRAPGEALFPDRYPLPVLMDRLEVLGSAFFQALYQQRPLDESRRLADGNWLKIVEIIPWTRLKLARVWDLAATEDGGDFTVGSLCGFDPSTDFFYILNIVRGQWKPAEVEKVVLQTAVKDGVHVEVVIEQEPGSAGKALVEHFNLTVLPEFKVTEYPSTLKKVLRAQPLLAGAEIGKVFMLQGHWNRDFVLEFDSFPGNFDDQVDTVSIGYTKLTGRRLYSATWGRNTDPSRAAFTKRTSERMGRQAQFSLAATSHKASWGSRTSNLIDPDPGRPY